MQNYEQAIRRQQTILEGIQARHQDEDAKQQDTGKDVFRDVSFKFQKSHTDILIPVKGKDFSALRPVDITKHGNIISLELYRQLKIPQVALGKRCRNLQILD